MDTWHHVAVVRSGYRPVTNLLIDAVTKITWTYPAQYTDLLIGRTAFRNWT